jgi:hypothetical protein
MSNESISALTNWATSASFEKGRAEGRTRTCDHSNPNRRNFHLRHLSACIMRYTCFCFLLLIFSFLKVVSGARTLFSRCTDGCSARWAKDNIVIKSPIIRIKGLLWFYFLFFPFYFYIVGLMRFERMTPWLKVRYSSNWVTSQFVVINRVERLTCTVSAYCSTNWAKSPKWVCEGFVAVTRFELASKAYETFELTITPNHN